MKQILMTSSFGTLKAAQQWNNLRNMLLNAGVDVVVMPKAPFSRNVMASNTSNVGLIYRNTFIPSRFHDDERTDEETYNMKWFADHQFNVIESNIVGERKLASFEGASDAIFDKQLRVLWCGVGNKSTQLFKHEILNREFSNTEFLPISLDLICTDLPYLDMCLCPLDSGGCLWYPEAFAPPSSEIIEQYYGESAVAVSELDARSLACNSISINSVLITPIISEELTEVLNDKGMTVIPLDMSEFQKVGGACRALILEVVS